MHLSSGAVINARIGCSGWQYKHWRGTFYPNKLPASQWFAYYTAHFDTVEINYTFYRLPEAATFAKWKRAAPLGFVYAIKASRFLTHMKKLKEPAEPLDRLLRRARALGTTFGPTLFQLPPRWPLNIARLRAFLEALPMRRRYAIEFRDPTWYDPKAFALLEDRGVALCLHDMSAAPSGKIDVGPFVYARFHGVTKYAGSYDDRTLDEWADWLAAHVKRGRQVFAYFNNDAGGHAPRDAARLRARIDARVRTG